MATTGDLEGTLRRLRREIRRIRFPKPLRDTDPKRRLRLGQPAIVLQLLSYILTTAFQPQDQDLAAKGYELRGKRDAPFLRSAFKLLRNEYGIRPCLTTDQFLEEGFAERKALLLLETIERCRDRHAIFARQLKAPQKRTQRRAQSALGESPMRFKAASVTAPSTHTLLCQRGQCKEQADGGALQAGKHMSKEVSLCRDGPRYENTSLKANPLSQVQLQLAELEREMASTKAEVLGSCVTSCNWLKALEQRVDRLERHHGIVLSADPTTTSATPLRWEQLTRDPDKPFLNHAAAAAGVAEDQACLTGALSALGQRKMCDRPVHTDRQSSCQTQRAGLHSISTLDLISRLQKRNNEVFTYLQHSQKSAAP